MLKNHARVWIYGVAIGLLLSSGCAMQPPEPSTGHLQPVTQATDSVPIPQPVQSIPLLPPPQEQPEEDVYTVVVSKIPVDDLLFALARDAKLNVDVYPGIEGIVTLNAIDQTLPQILDRLSRQVDMRYEIKGSTLIISPDQPYAHTYTVDYLNMSRDSRGTVSIATQIASTGTGRNAGATTSSNFTAGNNNSTQTIHDVSRHRFWETLVRNLQAVLGDSQALEDFDDEEEGERSLPITTTVIPHPEAGLLTVVATRRQHERVSQLLEQVLDSAQRQVLVEATVVEIALSYEYQTGVDWSRLADGDGFTLVQDMLGQTLSSSPFFLLNYTNQDSAVGNISVSIKALEQFGDVKILSSPKAMVLNNQTAVLKVVDNKVYFTMEAETDINNNIAVTTFESQLHTVPVGFVMTVTPQISDAEAVIMNVRPTVSRIIGFIADPNPALADADVESLVPEIQVREIESILRVNSGQTAVLGGLMQDSYDKGKSGLPGLTRTALSDAFGKHEDDFQKTELVIFLRPTVIRNASLDGDLRQFSHYLGKATGSDGGRP